MLSELKRAHEELLGCISELELVVSRDDMNASLIARTRLQLSRASSRRRRIVEEAILRLAKSVSVEENRKLNLLKENGRAILAASSSHVGEWTVDSILADREGYRTASSAMRRSMRDRIATEKSVLYPLLEKMDSHLS